MSESRRHEQIHLTEQPIIYVDNKRSRVVGIIFILFPIVALPITLAALAIFSFAAANGGISTTGYTIVNVVLTLLGLLAIIAYFALLPIGIVMVCRKKLDPSMPIDSRSGKKGDSQFPESLSGWNWGAAGLPLIWGVYHGVWLSLISLIPFVNWVWWIVMGLKGNQWAWGKNTWINEEHFRRAQAKWRPWGIAFFIIKIVLLVAILAIDLLVWYQASTFL